MKNRLPPQNADAVKYRAGYRCERCGTDSSPYWSIHHRKPRGMGGTKNPQIHALSNLLYLCGSGTTGCHGWIESNRFDAYDDGLLVSYSHNPSEVPCRLRYGLVRLLDDGGWQPC